MLNRNEIMAKEITGDNDWNEISRLYLNDDELMEFKNKLNWNIILNDRKNINNSILDKLIEEKIIEVNVGNMRAIQIGHANDFEFVKKYSKYFNARLIGNKKIFTAKQLIELFGKPKVLSGATCVVGSDKYPYTVIESKGNGLTIKVQLDDAIKTAEYDYYSNQDYTYVQNTKNQIKTLKLNKSGQWKDEDGMWYQMGHRLKYSNPSF